MSSILTVTPAAIGQIKKLLENRKKQALGLRIGIKTKGCSGLSYIIEIADEKNPYDEVVLIDDLTLLIDPKAIMFLLGTVMDFHTTDLESGFTFKNPNEKGRCGCGHFMFKIVCDYCKLEHDPPAMICTSCHHILPFYTMNPFLIFNIPPQLTVEVSKINPAYFQLQSKLHPDKLIKVKSQNEGEWAEAHIGQVNSAYRALQSIIESAKAVVLFLKDPLIPMEDFSEKDILSPNQEFLKSIFDLRQNPEKNQIENLLTESLNFLQNAVNTLNVSQILEGIGQYVYIQRLLVKDI